jgi:S1-C subfamily serine protease
MSTFSMIDHDFTRRRFAAAAVLALIAVLIAAGATPRTVRADEGAAPGVGRVIESAQQKIVKIYGAGGYRGMEPYQSGFLISPEGHILTVFSYVLDTDYITVVLWDGRRFEAKLLGADPRLEAAVLKIDAAALPCFNLAEAVEAAPSARVLALSNTFGVAMGDEPATVQHGIVSVVTNLAARRGVFETPYRGPVYVVDATTNNPGAAGGALVDRRGRLLAMLGKEMQNALNNTWLNYALPIDQLRPSVEEIRAGRFMPPTAEAERKPERSLELRSLGVVLVPDVLERTPPYVDHVEPGSPAEQAGMRPDDLIVLLGDRLIQSRKALAQELEFVDFEDEVKLTLIRQQELVEVTLRGAAPN